MWSPFRRPSTDIIIEDQTSEAGDHQSDYAGDLDYDDPLFHFECVGDFNLEDPTDRRKAQQIARLCEVANQSFFIFKTIVDEGEVVEKQILELDHFPGSEETYHSVQEQWGGGTYSIRCRTKPKLLLRSYTFDGPSRQPGKSEEHQSWIDLREKAQAHFLEAGLEQMRDDPEMYRELATSVMYQQFGVKRPKERLLRFDEKLIEDEIENNPRFREEIASRVAEKRFKTGRNEEGLESRLNDVKKFVEVSGLLTGGKRRSSLDLSAVLDEIVGSGALKEIVGLLSPSSAAGGQVSSDQQPPPVDASGPNVQPNVVGPVHAGSGVQGPTKSTPPSSKGNPIPQSPHRDRRIRSEAALAAVSRPLPSVDEIMNGTKTDDGEGPQNTISHD